MPDMLLTKEEFEIEIKSFSQTEEIEHRSWAVKNEKRDRSLINRIKLSVYPMLDNFGPYSSVLDLGCGAGVFFETYFSIASEKINKLGVDMCKEAIKEAKIKLPKCDFRAGDLVEDLKLIPENSFDLVTAFGVIHHVPSEEHRDKIYREMGRISKKNICIANYRGWVSQEKFFKSSKSGKRIYAVEQTKQDFIVNLCRVNINYRVACYLFDVKTKQNIVLLEFKGDKNESRTFSIEE